LIELYCDWEKHENHEGWVCAVWVEDYGARMNLIKKVWQLRSSFAQ